MAPSTKAAEPSARADSSVGNGVITEAPATGGASVKKKKQKKKQKQGGRQSDSQTAQPSSNSFGPSHHGLTNGHETKTQNATESPNDPQFSSEDPNLIDSDGDGQSPYEPAPQGLKDELAGNSSKRKAKKKKKIKASEETYDNAADNSLHYPASAFVNLPPPPPPPPQPNGGQISHTKAKDPIWNTSTYEERGRIKEFWLSLGEEERKSLVKIEKEAVLKKMKEQQKHSCSCTVCGRKRTAIEEELEVLYDAYYDELEQFANQQGTGNEPYPDRKLSPTRFNLPNTRLPPDRPPPLDTQRRMPRRRIQELPDGDDDDIGGDDVDDEEFSEDYDEDDEYSGDDTDEIAPVQATDFFNFGNSLTVKGGILTVADDLLKNDGKKFIDMMEQLAERRMQREEEAQYPPYGPHSAIPPGHSPMGPNHGSPEDDDYDEDDDEDYDSQDDEFDDDDDVDEMTESQRMEEGRRMFQIFAARMFEQRVLTAYREKVARERQDKLIQELEEESRADTQRDAKKAREAEKKKQKKAQQKQAKAEEKARKEEQKAAQEAAAREAEEKKQEEQKRKREEARRKKEIERKAQDEERLKKEAERVKRQQDERERQQEIERKAREAKAEEKKRRDEAKRKERDEREAKEKEARERKTQEEKLKKGEEDRVKTEQDAKERKRRDEQAAQLSESSKRTALPAVVAVPPVLKRHVVIGSPSPQAKVATPVIPKAPTPTPGRNVHTSTPVSHGSPPHTPQVLSRSRQSTSPKAPSSSQPSVPSTRAPSQHFPQSQLPPLSPMYSNMPPPDVQTGTYHGIQSSGINPFPGPQGPIHGGTMPRQIVGQHPPPFPPYIPHMAPQQRPFMPPQSLGPQLGMGAPIPQGFSRGYTPELAAGFHYPPSTSSSANIQQSYATTRDAMKPHSRQHSMHFDPAPIDVADAAPTQPIARPHPIKRPTSPRTADSGREGKRSDEVDELSQHLGSASLLADDDGPMPQGRSDASRRASGAPHLPNQINNSASAAYFDPGQAAFSASSRGNPSEAWRSPMSQYGSVGMNSPTAGWGNAQSSGWSNPSAFGAQRNAMRPNLQQIRFLACGACKQLNGRASAAADDFHDINEVVRHINIGRITEPAITADDIRLILDTEGDAQNGGGYFTTRDEMRGNQSIRWDPDTGMPRATRTSLALLGEIGSPATGKSLPSLGGLGPRHF